MSHLFKKRSKSKERAESEVSELEETAIMAPTIKYKEVKEMPQEFIQELTDNAEELPEELYGEIITKTDGSPIYYFGSTKFQNSARAIWKKDGKIYSLDPKRVIIPDDYNTYHIYEDPDKRHTSLEKGATNVSPDPKTIDPDPTKKNEGNTDSKMSFQINDISESMNKITQLLEMTLKANSMKSSENQPQLTAIKPDLEYIKPTIRNGSLEERFSKFLIDSSKLVNYLTPLDHEQGPSYSLWLQNLQTEMKQMAMPTEFLVQVAIRKLPEKIRGDIIAKKVGTMEELQSALFDIYCGTQNALSLKTQFIRTNKMAPHDRDYNDLRNKIMRTQVPQIISVERTGYSDPPFIKDRLIEERSNSLATELFLNGIQEDAKRSVLNKGSASNCDELVKRANDFASSIQSDTQATRIGTISNGYGNQEKCKIHPISNHSQMDCRAKCQKHPMSNHKGIDCKQPNTTQQQRTCHPQRAGTHAEPLWCIFCNTVEPKLENHRCFHCWKHSTKEKPLNKGECECPPYRYK